MVIALVIVFALFSVLTKGVLLSAQNMTNLLLQNGYVLVMACGMLLCILTGGNIDLSVGSVVCLVGGVAAVMVTNMGMPAIPVILLCLVLGLLVGVWQGYWIGYVRIPPFITTLGGMFIFRGIGRFVLNSKTVAVHDPTFLNIFTAYIKIPRPGRRPHQALPHPRRRGGRGADSRQHRQEPQGPGQEGLSSEQRLLRLRKSA